MSEDLAFYSPICSVIKVGPISVRISVPVNRVWMKFGFPAANLSFSMDQLHICLVLD